MKKANKIEAEKATFLINFIKTIKLYRVCFITFPDNRLCGTLKNLRTVREA